MGALKVGGLGEFLREQRRSAQLSLRQLADAAGVSNPYLSQIERGLRKPSAEILQQLAKALRISAETLYVQAGILDERERAELEVPAAIVMDPSINERQKQVLIQIYESFRKENAAAVEQAERDQRTKQDEQDRQDAARVLADGYDVAGAGGPGSAAAPVPPVQEETGT